MYITARPKNTMAFGSQFIIYGDYGNILLRTHGYNVETVDLTIHYGYEVKKQSLWKFMSSDAIPISWKDTSFVDDTWFDYQHGSESSLLQCEKTYYYRLHFMGESDLPAYEIRLNYQYGIIVYINGNEIIRENMPFGIVGSTTPATGGFNTIGYRGFIRYGSEIVLGDNTVAVELHWTSDRLISASEFDAWIAQYSSGYDTSCYVYPYHINVQTPAMEFGIDYLTDFNLGTEYRKKGTMMWKEEEHEMTFTFSDSVFPSLSFMDLYVGSTPAYLPQHLDLYGCRENPYIENDYLSSSEKAGDLLNEYQRIPVYPLQSLYHRYRLELSFNTLLIISEMRIEICSSPHETVFTYPLDHQTVTQFTAIKSMSPIPSNSAQCTVAGVVPAGITVVESTCLISGVPSEYGHFEFTVTASKPHMGRKAVQFDVKACDGAVVRVDRVYGIGGSHYETVVVTRVENDVPAGIVYEENEFGHQMFEAIVTTSLCLSGTQYLMMMDSSSNTYWEDGSSISFYQKVHDVDVLLFSGRYDSRIGAGKRVILNVNGPIRHDSEWYYLMGSIPSTSNWYASFDFVGWSLGRHGRFPISPNQLQIYKRLFMLSSYDLDIVHTLQFVIWHEFGCVVFINGREIFRHHISSHDLTNSTTSTAIRSTEKHRYITLPTRMYGMKGETYLKIGENLIVLVLVAEKDAAMSGVSVFDCLMELIHRKNSRRSMNMELQMTNFDVSHQIMDNSYSENLVSSVCTQKSVTAEFKPNRWEWFNVVTFVTYDTDVMNKPTNIMLKGKAVDSDDWVTIRTVKNMWWEQRTQSISIFLFSDTVFSRLQIIFQDNTESQCNWILHSIRLEVYNQDVTTSHLSYYYTTLMSENIPNIHPDMMSFSNFTFTNTVPSIRLHPVVGTITGSVTADITEFIVTATRIDGVVESCTLRLHIQRCVASNSQVTIALYPGEDPLLVRWEIRSDVLPTISLQSRVISFIPYSITLCLPPALYTLHFPNYVIDLFGPITLGSFSITNGPYITLSYGSLTFVSKDPFVYFSTYTFNAYDEAVFCFSPMYDESEDEKWFLRDFDASYWAFGPLNAMIPIKSVMVRIRWSYVIDVSMNPSFVLIDFYYEDGFVFYVNGKFHSVYNMPSKFDHLTYAYDKHDITKPVRQMLRFPNDNLQFYDNIFAVEVHYSRSHVQPSKLLFNIKMKIVPNDDFHFSYFFTNITSNSLESSDIDSIFDSNMNSNAIFRLSERTEIEWSVDQGAPLKFNRFGINALHVHSIVFSLYGLREMEKDSEWIPLMSYRNITFDNNEINFFEVESVLLGFTHFKVLIDGKYASKPYLVVHTIFFGYYQNVNRDMCAAVAPYEAAYVGAMSPYWCSVSTQIGYRYRICNIDGRFDKEVTSLCIQKPVTNLVYLFPNEIVAGIVMAIVYPSFTNEALSFEVFPPLPKGLRLDPIFGRISGMTSELISKREYTVRALNGHSVVSTTIRFNTRLPLCIADGEWKETVLESTVKQLVKLCDKNEVGMVTRVCILGVDDGEWCLPERNCVNRNLFVLIMTVAVMSLSVIISPFLCCLDNPLHLRRRVDPMFYGSSHLKMSRAAKHYKASCRARSRTRSPSLSISTMYSHSQALSVSQSVPDSMSPSVTRSLSVSSLGSMRSSVSLSSVVEHRRRSLSGLSLSSLEEGIN